VSLGKGFHVEPLNCHDVGGVLDIVARPKWYVDTDSNEEREAVKDIKVHFVSQEEPASALG